MAGMYTHHLSLAAMLSVLPDFHYTLKLLLTSFPVQSCHAWVRDSGIH